MLLEAVGLLEGHETYEAENVLVVGGAVLVQAALVAEVLEADLAGVVGRADVGLEGQEGGQGPGGRRASQKQL